MTKYSITYIVDEHKKISFLTAADPHGELMRCAKLEEPQQPPVVQKAPLNGGSRYAGGVRNKGISGEQLVIDSLLNSPKPLRTDELAQIFVNRGFARTSASSLLSIMRTGKKVTQDLAGRWTLASSK